MTSTGRPSDKALSLDELIAGSAGPVAKETEKDSGTFDLLPCQRPENTESQAELFASIPRELNNARMLVECPSSDDRESDDEFESFCSRLGLDRSDPESRHFFEIASIEVQRARKKARSELEAQKLKCEQAEQKAIQAEQKTQQAIQDAEQLRLNNKFSNLLNKMEKFAIMNDSTAKDTTPTLSRVYLDPQRQLKSLEGLSLAGLAPPPPLSLSDWQRVRDTVDWRLINGDNDESVVEAFFEKLLEAIQAVSPSATAVCRPLLPMGGRGDIPDLTMLHESLQDAQSNADGNNVAKMEKPRTEHRSNKMVIPIKLNLIGKYQNAIIQALGQLMRTMLDRLEIVDLRQKKHHTSFCLASDGDKVSVGKILVDLEKYEVKIAHSQFYRLREDKTAPFTEPPGVQIIRALMHSSPEALGHVAEHRLGDFLVSRVLGRGGFCVALAARHKDDPMEANAEVVIKKCKLVDSVGLNEKQTALIVLKEECEVLRRFCSCAVLPQLAQRNWAVNESTPYLPMKPLGEELRGSRYATLPLDQRAELVPGLVADLREATHHALAAGYCHTDIRAENIVVVPGTTNEDRARFVLIDWGLARAPNTHMHKHRGGLAYYHDDLVDAWRKNRLESTPFKAAYDQQSIKYVVFAFATRTDEESMAWSEVRSASFLSARREAFERWMKKQSSDVRDAVDFLICD